MKNRAKRILFILFILICGALLGTTTPEKAIALTVSPVRIEREVDPGTTFSDKISLQNDKSETQTYYIQFRNFESQGENGQPVFTTNNSGLASWMSAVKSVTVAPKEWKDVNLEITVPQDADPGGYTAAIFGTTLAPDIQGNSEVGVESDVGALVLLRVKGNFEQGATILDFKTTNTENTPRSLPVDFSFRFQNIGDSWVKPIGDITIKNIFGRTSKLVPANPAGSNVLSKSIRKFETSWLASSGGSAQDPKAERPPAIPQGFWNKVKHEWKYFALGRYTANLSLTYNNDTSTTTAAKTTFWVIPWHLLAVIAAGLAVLIGIITLIVVTIVVIVLKQKKKK